MNGVFGVISNITKHGTVSRVLYCLAVPTITDDYSPRVIVSNRSCDTTPALSKVVLNFIKSYK